MKKTFLLLFVVFSVLGTQSQTTLIKNVSLVDVKAGKVLPGYAVLISNGIIEQVGPFKKIKPAANTTEIDGAGKFLMPGLADAHIHFFQSGGLYTRPDGLDLRKKYPYEKELEFGRNNVTDYLSRYLRLGITTVVDVGGPFENFNVRDKVAPTVIAPNILVTGPLFSMVDRPELGSDKPIIKITNNAEADSLMQKMLPYKPDFIKIWYIAGDNLPAEKNFELVKYIAAKTHENRLKLAVHATELKTAQLAVEAGADILVHSISDAIIPDDFVKILLQKKVTYIPTLIVGSNYYKVFSGLLPHHPQDLKWANAFTYGSLSDPEAMTADEMHPILKYLRKAGIPASEKTADSICAINLVKLVQAGVNIAAGTDAGNIGTQHASSYQQELEAMQAAGMSSAAILKAATINTAVGFGKENKWGSIEKGKQADLLLLTKNPLESIGYLQDIDMVFKNGIALMPDSILKESPEAIVQRQLNAYNARNLEAFMATYADSVELYQFPNQLLSKGKKAMIAGYESMFKSIPNLHCQILNRMVNGSVVIDKEKVRIGNEFLEAVAIYEVANGKIKKVTFIQ
ncbi:MAG: amidohydrolase family protein [Gloeobacteraceae cyanobacterium ES-bin-316]|nr:amidohydrolase family protein [Ferruginibacter sp.]